MTKEHIIIVGGGFGGVACAATLIRELPANRAEVVLFNSENHLVFSPLLAEVVGSTVNPIDVVVPIRQLLPGIFCRTEEVKSIDLERREIIYECDGGQTSRMAYDHLVLACGNATNLNVVPGMADHAFPLKSVADAAALRSHIMEEMEKAEVSSDPVQRQWHLTIIVVGGGFSGAEAAGEINDLVRTSARYFRNFRAQDGRVILIHSRDQLLPEISPGLREFARRKMESSGVQVVLNARVAYATRDGVGLQGGQFIKGGTIVCTVGNSPTPFVERLAVPKEKGRLLTEPDMRLRGLTNVWAIGDCALITNAFDNTPSPTTGQFAEREGKQCARNIVRSLQGQPTRPFSFKQLGELCSIGGHSAVADLFGFHLSGFLAWFVWRGVYLFKLPTWARRFQVGFDWAWLLVFPRDLAHVRTRPTERVSHAYYQAGDIVIQAGEPATNFYVIERGEVEVLRAGPRDPHGQVVAVLGPGSFFGEKALLSDEPRTASVRARTELKVLVMGRNVFTQISSALTPLRDALAQALNRRTSDLWKEAPQIGALLEKTSVSGLMDPIPQPLLSPTMTFREVGQAFVDHNNEFFYLSSDNETLEGIITITDLIRGRSAGAIGTTPAREFMTANPVALALDDTCAVAFAAIREYRLKSLPVVQRKDTRKLAGCVRIRRLMAFVFGAAKPGAESEPVAPQQTAP
jgi:NADH dehydrogenase